MTPGRQQARGFVLIPRLSRCGSPTVLETVSLSWSELAQRTWRETLDDDVLGLAAQLA